MSDKIKFGPFFNMWNYPGALPQPLLGFGSPE